MENEYVIQSTISWINKKGQACMDISYFKDHSGFPIPLNHMVGKLEEAKKYKTKRLAQTDRKKYFYNKPTTQVVPA